MTIIASFSIDGYPIVMGDLMLSRYFDDRSYKPFNIPSHDDVNRLIPATTGCLISGLRQKVNLLSHRVAVAWAGDMESASAIIIDLKKCVQADSFTISALESFFDRLPKPSGKVYFTGMMIEPAKPSRSFVARFAWDSELGWNSGIHHSPAAKECYVGGSGSSDFKSILDQLPVAPKSSRKLRSIEKAIGMAFSVVGHLTGEQMRTGLGLDAFYGGGFELATIMDSEIKKVGDVTYHLWEVTSMGKDDPTITFHSALKYDYHEDLLLVRRTEAFDVEGEIMSENVQVRDELYVMFPLYRRPSDKEKKSLEKNLEWPPLNSRFSVIYLHFPEARTGKNIASIIHMSSDEKPDAAVRYVRTGEFVEMQLRRELLDRVKSMLERAL